MTVHHNSNQEIPSAMAELISLIENEIPEGRQNLIDSNSNLEKVADYCETNYFQSDNKRSALEETKNYTTQSLASVAYQVNTLAYNLLHMLDLQTAQLAEMESQINHISQTVSIHKEKVARREIGILTSNKTTVRQHKILVPANPERPIKYIRKPIDYSVLDEIGHGVKISQTNAPRSKTQTLKNGSGTLMMSGSGPAPTTKPPTPPQTVRNVGSLSRGNKEYRTPAPPIAPPQVPSNYAPNYPIGHPKAHENRRGSGYSTLPLGLGHQSGVISNVMQQMGSQSGHQSHYGQSMHGTAGAPQPIGMVHPITHPAHHHHNSASANFVVPPSPTPPPPPPPPVVHELPVSPISDSLPEPPQHLQHNQHNDHYERHSNASPPLPPPPPIEDNHQIYHMEHMPQNAISYRDRQNNENEWIPSTYLEKVIAIYDYAADKDDELSFQENSVIYVIRKNDDGWYEGVMDGITGLFPGNYVEPCI